MQTSSYENPVAGDLAAAATVSTSLDEALRLFGDAEQAVLADVAFLPLWTTASRYVVGDRLAGLPLDGFGNIRWAELARA